MKLILNNLEKNYQLPTTTLQSKTDDDREDFVLETGADMFQSVQKRAPVSILMKNYTCIFIYPKSCILL